MSDLADLDSEERIEWKDGQPFCHCRSCQRWRGETPGDFFTPHEQQVIWQSMQSHRLQLAECRESHSRHIAQAAKVPETDVRTERLISAALVVGALNRENEQIRPMTIGGAEAWIQLENAVAEYDGTSVTCVECGVVTPPQFAEFCIGEVSHDQPDYWICQKCANR